MSHQATHKIQNMVLDLGLPPSSDSWMMQKQISDVFYEHVLPEFEQVFNECCTLETVFSIDQLVIETESITMDRLSNDWGQIITEALRKQLFEQYSLTQAQSIAAPVSNSIADHKVNILSHFLDHGTLPWWVTEDQFNDMNELVTQLLTNAPDKVLFTIEKIIDNSEKRNRVILQMSPDIIFQIIKAKKPGLLKTIDRLDKCLMLVKPRLIKINDPEKLKGILLETSLRFAFSSASAKSSNLITEVFNALQTHEKWTIDFLKDCIAWLDEKLDMIDFQVVLSKLLQQTQTQSIRTTEQDSVIKIQVGIAKKKHDFEEDENLDEQHMIVPKSFGQVQQHKKSTSKSSENISTSSALPANITSISNPENQTDTTIQNQKTKESLKTAHPTIQQQESTDKQQTNQGQTNEEKQQSAKKKAASLENIDTTTAKGHKAKTSKKNSLSPENIPNHTENSNHSIAPDSTHDKQQLAQKEQNPTDAPDQFDVKHPNSKPVYHQDEDRAHDQIEDTTSPPEHNPTLESIAHKSEILGSDDVDAQSFNEPLSFESMDETSPTLDKYYIDNAGLIITWPFLPRLFETLGITSNDEFRNFEHQVLAAHLIQYLCSSQMDTPEYQLVLNKLLSGIALNKPVTRKVDIDESQRKACHELIYAITEHWMPLKGTSIDGVQQSFFARQGVLKAKSSGWLLQIEKSSYDMLLEQLPWSIGLVRLPWMDKPIYVEW